MKNILFALYLLANFLLYPFLVSLGQTEKSYEAIAFFQSAEIIKIEPCIYLEGWSKVYTNRTYNGREICMYFEDSITIPLCVLDTIFVDSIIRSDKFEFLMILNWEMIHHHDCNLTFTPKKEIPIDTPLLNKEFKKVEK